MERRFRRFFDEPELIPAPIPAADVYETDGEYVIELEVPGFQEKQLAVEVTDHTLLVKGDRAETKEKTEKAFRLHERLARQFVRRFELPPTAVTDKIAAEFKQGVLTVHAPKEEATTPHKVAIAAK
jgi:HSP20 family protein